MPTLSEVTANVADQLSRNDMDAQIIKEIGLAIRRYSREMSYLTEVRGGTLFLAPRQMWYSTFNLTTASGLQGTAGRTVVPFSNVLDINFVRMANAELLEAFLLQNGDPLLTEDERLILLNNYLADEGNWGWFDVLEKVHHSCFEDQGPWPWPSFAYGYCMYAGQMGLWPSDDNRAVYISATVKPMIPVDADDTSVFFDEAQELIEAAAAKAVCAKYLQDVERATVFGTLEQALWNDIQRETNRKATTGRLMARY